MRRSIAIISAFSLTLTAASAQADDIGGESIVIPTQIMEVVEVESVQLAPPPYVTIQATSVAVGLGIRWGEGTLLFEGERHGFSLQGVSLIDVGFSKLNAEGWVQNLDNMADFAGHYVAVEAGVAVGAGASALAMRNEHGVVISLRSELEGVQLTLGAQGFRIVLN